jgi:peptidoglycan/LPS O-acetylase OafA/YrhL
MIRTLQSLRFLFVGMIFLSHFSYGTIPTFNFGGDCGVAFFFILSGFGISCGYGEHLLSHQVTFRTFFLKRIIKLYPLHLLCLLAYLILCFVRLKDYDLLPFLPNALLLQSWIPLSKYHFSANGVSWFLSDIVFCYLLFPFLYRVISRSSWKKLTYSCVAIIMAYALFICLIPSDKADSFVYVFPLARAIDFSLGIVTFKMYQKLRTIKLSGNATLIQLLPFVLLILNWFLYEQVDIRIRLVSLYWLNGILFVLIFALYDQQGGPIIRFWHSKILQELGKISFILFLIHPLMIYVTMRSTVHLGISMNYATALAASFILTVIVAWLIERYLQEPVTHWLQTKILGS